MNLFQFLFNKNSLNNITQRTLKILEEKIIQILIFSENQGLTTEFGIKFFSFPKDQKQQNKIRFQTISTKSFKFLSKKLLKHTQYNQKSKQHKEEKTKQKKKNKQKKKTKEKKKEKEKEIEIENEIDLEIEKEKEICDTFKKILSESLVDFQGKLDLNSVKQQNNQLTSQQTKKIFMILDSKNIKKFQLFTQKQSFQQSFKEKKVELSCLSYPRIKTNDQEDFTIKEFKKYDKLFSKYGGSLLLLPPLQFSSNLVGFTNAFNFYYCDSTKKKKKLKKEDQILFRFLVDTSTQNKTNDKNNKGKIKSKSKIKGISKAIKTKSPLLVSKMNCISQAYLFENSTSKEKPTKQKRQVLSSDLNSYPQIEFIVQFLLPKQDLIYYSTKFEEKYLGKMDQIGIQLLQFLKKSQLVLVGKIFERFAFVQPIVENLFIVFLMKENFLFPILKNQLKLLKTPEISHLMFNFKDLMFHKFDNYPIKNFNQKRASIIPFIFEPFFLKSFSYLHSKQENEQQSSDLLFKKMKTKNREEKKPSKETKTEKKEKEKGKGKEKEREKETEKETDNYNDGTNDNNRGILKLQNKYDEFFHNQFFNVKKKQSNLKPKFQFSQMLLENENENETENKNDLIDIENENENENEKENINILIANTNTTNRKKINKNSIDFLPLKKLYLELINGSFKGMNYFHKRLLVCLQHSSNLPFLLFLQKDLLMDPQKLELKYKNKIITSLNENIFLIDPLIDNKVKEYQIQILIRFYIMYIQEENKNLALQKQIDLPTLIHETTELIQGIGYLLDPINGGLKIFLKNLQKLLFQLGNKILIEQLIKRIKVLIEEQTGITLPEFNQKRKNDKKRLNEHSHQTNLKRNPFKKRKKNSSKNIPFNAKNLSDNGNTFKIFNLKEKKTKWDNKKLRGDALIQHILNMNTNNSTKKKKKNKTKKKKKKK
ncbi:chascon isoform d-related [Anaeramoeba flamelloides]|uniref:Chascon isoform d-related n=1 Tax=Anaeramoeba flamelloides TaxID=1746091 RepID=A0AAV7ZLP6_9EUKA|nr:chascon isoform d-related [Anaeramoeba flamelloides]